MLLDLSTIYDDIAELQRQVQNMVRIGTIEEIDYTTAKAKVRLDVKLLTTGLPWTTRRASNDVDWWAPEIGEQVVVLSPGGELSQGIIDQKLYQTAHPAPENLETVSSTTYSDGAKISYDRENSILTASLPAGATVSLIADGGIGFTGDLSVDGNITSTKDITATGEISDTDGTLKRLRENYNTATYIGNMGAPTSTTSKPDA